MITLSGTQAFVRGTASLKGIAIKNNYIFNLVFWAKGESYTGIKMEDPL